ncbi:MAG TPA: class II aldolase/adducin family protein [Solirubrobacteraceae bacterium]|nr:class II aldolase/adducin family protein [Solirubrobacteraceae bacterium]
MATADLEPLRVELAAAAHEVADAGLAIGTGGNISARSGELVAISPTGAELSELQPEQVTIIDLAGELVAGSLAPTSELDLHLGVYERYAAGAVVHTHPPIGTALSCVLHELPCIHYQMLLLGGEVRVAPYRTFGSPELAEVTLDALEGKSAALMANHGAIAFGNDLNHAVKQSLLLEWACGIYWTAASIGTPRALDEDARAAVIEQAVRRNYGATREPA